VSGFDRIKSLEQRLLERPVEQRPDGRGALYSATARPVPVGTLGGLACDGCGARSAVDVGGALRLVRRGVVVLPRRGLQLYGACPACRSRRTLRPVRP
jgi:hypothetical protein